MPTTAQKHYGLGFLAQLKWPGSFCTISTFAAVSCSHPAAPEMHIQFIWVGKTRSSPIRSLSEDYLERLRHLVSCEVVEVRDVAKRRAVRDGEAITAEGAEIARFLPEHCRLVVLDERGLLVTSAEFARWFQSEQNRGTREIAFVIGGPEGISPAVSEKAHLALSLGKMTWTHEMSRALLLEQVYRAHCILRRIPYHK
jgi:23S rRNA (pseudouridine1915-N3)-methyltransferase